jgi:hypothetical protein
MSSLPISFLSDFGHADEFVGVVHGVVARIAPDVRVIDVTHGVPRGDVRAGALALMRAIQYLPGGVALGVVDPGVGAGRRGIAARTEWGFFVGPDNGLLAPAVAMVGGADAIVALENQELRLPADGVTFDGRDLFGPAAAVLASGQAGFEDLGPAVPLESVTPLMIPLVESLPGQVVGRVLWVDHFGNAQTNISPQDLAGAGLTKGDDLVVRIGAMEFPIGWVDAYGDVAVGEGLLHVDSYGQIAVAVREGRADDRYPLEPSIVVTIKSATADGDRLEIQGVAPTR